MEGEDHHANINNEETLPPGFRFHPTDEELINFYLINKISDASFTCKAIADVDLNKCEPWELPAKAKMGVKEWYFFNQRDKKYPTGVRTNRATNSGYWKTTGKDKEVFHSVTSELVGMKKTLVFYRGRAPRGEKSNWIMHEYRIHSKSSFRTSKDEWVVCRVFQKSAGAKKFQTTSSQTRTVMNPYNLEIGSSINHVVPPQMMQLGDPNHFSNYGRNFITNPELAEFSKVFRGSGSTSSGTINLPLQSQLMNHPIEGGCFTISGLNLNLGGSAQQQPVFQPLTLQVPPQTTMNQLEIASSMMSTTGSSLAPDQSGYGTTDTINNGNEVPNNRSFMSNMDNCMDLDNYWPSY